MKWIDIKDKPPKTEDRFLIWPHHKYAGISAMFWPYDDFRGHKKDSFEITSDYDDINQIEVTHWMPLPAPPKL